jgi:hypothetical protein
MSSMIISAGIVHHAVKIAVDVGIGIGLLGFVAGAIFAAGVMHYVHKHESRRA